MCVTNYGKFVPNEGGVVGYADWMRVTIKDNRILRRVICNMQSAITL
ncbi:hypothetical protein AALC75_08395 [Lachnospiraceae bacterium 48-42]